MNTKASDCVKNSAKQNKVREFEEQIDQIVSKLYGFTEDEIKIVESSIK